MNKLDVAEKLTTGDGVEGFVRVDVKLLPELGHRYCFVIMTTTREEFSAGDYALIDLDAEIASGDRVLLAETEASTSCVMRAIKTEDGWTLAPLKRSLFQPVFVTELGDLVIGKVVRVFDVKGRTGS